MRIDDTNIAALAAIAGALSLGAGGAQPWAIAAGSGAAAWLAGRWYRRRHGSAAAAALRHAVQAAVRRRDEHLARTAHELRTPLTSVVTALEMLREGYATTRAEIEEFLDQGTVAARHLAFLVNDVLDHAALDAGRLRLHCTEHRVRELLAEVAQVLGVQARARGIDLHLDHVDDQLAVRTDARRFLQVVFNLVGNALKFTAAGDRVGLHIAVLDGAVRFRVVDTGPGVPQEMRSRLFVPFGRADDVTGVEGTGLGLHLCQRLVTQMGGRIGYAEAPGRGSEFWFEQPLVAVEPVAAAPAAAP